MNYIYRLLIMLMPITIVGFANGQHYIPVDDKSTIEFVIKNFGFSTKGTFNGLSGSINFDQASISESGFMVNINAASINTGIKARDNHLGKEEYFNVKKYPVIQFTSVKIEAGKEKNSYNVTGNLFIKGVNKQIQFLFTALEDAGYIIFKGSFPLNRKDFGIGGKSISLSDNLTVNLTVFAKKI